MPFLHQTNFYGGYIKTPLDKDMEYLSQTNIMFWDGNLMLISYTYVRNTLKLAMLHNMAMNNSDNTSSNIWARFCNLLVGYYFSTRGYFLVSVP